MNDTFRSLAQSYILEDISYEEYHESVNSLPEEYVQSVMDQEIDQILEPRHFSGVWTEIGNKQLGSQSLADSLPLIIQAAKEVYRPSMPGLIASYDNPSNLWRMDVYKD